MSNGSMKMSVYQKLQTARIRLQGIELKKSGYNKYSGYSYFELKDFLPSVQEIFADLKLCGVVSFAEDIATLKIVDFESGGEIVITSPMGSAALKGCHEVQNIGAVETYQRRYLWLSAMEIVEHDVLDATTTKADPDKVTTAFQKAPVKGGKKTISATDGALDSLDNEQRNKVEQLAYYICDEHASGNEWSAFEAWDTTDLDNDAKVAVWSLLNSKVRSTIKAMKAEADKQVTI